MKSKRAFFGGLAGIVMGVSACLPSHLHPSHDHRITCGYDRSGYFLVQQINFLRTFEFQRVLLKSGEVVLRKNPSIQYKIRRLEKRYEQHQVERAEYCHHWWFLSDPYNDLIQETEDINKKV